MSGSSKKYAVEVFCRQNFYWKEQAVGLKSAHDFLWKKSVYTELYLWD